MKSQNLKKKCTMATGFSGARLALNYYMLEDGLIEEEPLSAAFGRCTDTLRTLLGRYINGETPADEVAALRVQVTREMEVITAYTDCFLLYEYVLNRMERRFETDPPAVSESGIMDELVNFVKASQDSVVMNGRIQQIIGQLPVRFTRKKFYAMVREALTVYLGTDRDSLNSLLYMLRSSAMTGMPADMKTGYEDLDEILGGFRTIDFKQLDADGYHEMSRRITYVSGLLNRYSGWYLILQEIINDFYVLILTRGKAIINLEEAEAVLQIIKTLLELPNCPPNEGEGELPNCPPNEGEGDNLLLWLADLEGIQESYYEKYLRAAAAEPQDDEPLSEEAQLSRKLDLLLSGSSFVSLEEPEQGGVMVDAAWLDEQTDAFFQELDMQFAKSQKPVGRAMMAAILSQLPVCFNQIEEFELYINGSLSSCADHAEKESCIELLRQLMESEYAMV